MAWFDRNPGVKKSSEIELPKVAEAAKPAPEPTPQVVAAAPEPKPIPKVEVAPGPPATAGLVGYLYKGCRVTGARLADNRCGDEDEQATRQE